MRTKIRVSKLDLYLLGEVVRPFFGALIFFSFVFLMGQALRLSDFLIVHGVPLPVLGKLASLMLLSFQPITVPIAFLVSVLIAFARVSADNEIVAMKACGMSLFRITRPVLLFSFAVVLTSFALNLDWTPRGERLLKATIIKIGNTKVVSAIKEGTFTTGFFDLLVFADKADPKTNRLERVFIFDERQTNNPFTVIAKQGEIVPVLMDNPLGSAAMLRLYDGNIHHNQIDVESYQRIDFQEYRVYLQAEEGVDSSVVQPREHTKARLLQMRRETDPMTPRYLELTAELWRRYAIALSPVLFTFLGIGFGTTRSRMGKGSSTLIAFVTLVIYWSLQSFAWTLATHGKLPPQAAMLIPNLVVAVVAIFAYRRASW